MSDANPFEKPAEPSTCKTPESNPSGPPSIPTSLMVIAIIGMILGMFGLIGVCIGGASLAMSDMAVGMQPSEEARVATRKLLDLQFIPTVIQLVLSLIVAPILVAGCIGCLTRKLWSQGLMKIALLGSILSALVGLGVNAWIMLFHWDTLMGGNAAQPGAEAITMGIQAFTFVFVLALLGFYIWALIAMGGQKISEFYDSISAAGR